jgi:Flp pilus assembly CpaE family ATPase
VRIHYLPEDRASVDRALSSGRSLVELGDSPLRRGIGAIADSVLGMTTPGVRRRGRWRAQPPNNR